MVDRYAVFGHPISHSKSPRIHTLFAEQAGQSIDYQAIDVAPERFVEAVSGFRAAGGRGLNCTVPLKEQAFRLADSLSDRAQRAGAVNTIIFAPHGQITGDNTDGVGLLRDLTENLGLTITGKSLLILGAGGAVRGILQPLMAENPERLTIANRTPAKAEQLAHEFADLATIKACEFAQLRHENFDIVLNATAASLSGDLPPLPDKLLRPNGVCYDLAYGTEPTAFVRWGQSVGAAQSVDGIGMLVEQAAEAFWLWRGVRPQTKPVIRLIDSERSLKSASY